MDAFIGLFCLALAEAANFCGRPILLVRVYLTAELSIKGMTMFPPVGANVERNDSGGHPAKSRLLESSFTSSQCLGRTQDSRQHKMGMGQN